MKKLFLAAILFTGLSAFSQEVTNVDTLSARLTRMDKFMNILREFRLSVYMQPEYQLADTAGQKGVAAGNFPANVNNRFLIRRGRMKLGYEHYIKDAMGRDSLKVIEAAFQFDATEKGFNAVKDFYGKIIDPWTGWFGFQGGIFLRPFGMETPAPPAYWESPEFARVNQTIMNNECEEGAAIVIESPKSFQRKYNLDIRADAGMFNGFGVGSSDPISGAVVTSTYQSRKDFIGRLQATKLIPYGANDNVMRIIVGTSLYQGNVLQTNSKVYNVETNSAGELYFNKIAADTLGTNKNYFQRQYAGAHAEFRITYGKKDGKVGGSTMLRGEYIGGKEPGLTSTSSPVISAVDTNIHLRHFNSAIVYVTQTIKHKRGGKTSSSNVDPYIYHDFTMKFDVYNPNTQVAQTAMTSALGFSGADVLYRTIGLGYTFRPYNWFKLMVWYDIVTNAKTGITGYTTDLKDNVLTIRTQFMFDTKFLGNDNNPNKLGLVGY